MVFGSVDLGVENLGVWAGRAKVNLADADNTHPVTVGRWDEAAKGDPSTTHGPSTTRDPSTTHDSLTIHTRDRAYTFETLYWERLNLVEGVPSTVKMVTKKTTSALHRKVIKAPIDVQVDFATRPDRIPAVIERFKELGVTHVLIESQLTNLGTRGGPSAMSGNILMKVLSHIIQVLVKLNLPDATITFVSGHSTIPLCEDIMWAPTSKWTQTLGLERVPRGTPRTKPRKKSLAKNVVKYALELIYGSAKASRKPGVDRSVQRKNYPSVFSSYLTSKKKDDLADSLLQVLGFLRRAKLTVSRKRKSGKPVKRKRGEIPEPSVPDTQLDRGMYNSMMRKRLKIEKEKPLTKAQMKATLQAWKCKGFASLKKAPMTEFYEAARAVREKAGLPTDPLKASTYIPVDTGNWKARKVVPEPRPAHYLGDSDDSDPKEEKGKKTKSKKPKEPKVVQQAREPKVVEEPRVVSESEVDEEDVETDSDGSL
jgi:hypothetical protein